MWSWTDVALVLVAYALLAALLGWYSVTQIRRALAHCTPPLTASNRPSKASVAGSAPETVPSKT